MNAFIVMHLKLAVKQKWIKRYTKSVGIHLWTTERLMRRTTMIPHELAAYFHLKSAVKLSNDWGAPL
jgi:hypothetical protein